MSPKEVKNTINEALQRFIRLEGLSSIFLFLAAAIALIWANSLYADQYFALWQTKLTLGIGDALISKPLLLWINDGLMAIFFFFVGLEIKREFLGGELNSSKKAMLPIFAALGGSIFPVILFLIFQNGAPGSAAWGIPMATDIAFALGILMLLGKSVPLSLKVFLTALAIIDDILAVLVIAIFYSSKISLLSLGTLILFFVIMLIANKLNVRKIWPYIILGIGAWYFALQSGIHPTIAGIITAFMIPGNSRSSISRFLKFSEQFVSSFRTSKSKEVKRFLTQHEINRLENIKLALNAVQPPLQRLENSLHGFVAFFIIPVFALANAGVYLDFTNSKPFGLLSLSVIIGLVAGKSIGITFLSWIAVKLGYASLPGELRWTDIFATGLLAGVGFTMSLFIANLALEDAVLLTQAKTGILAGSIIAGISGYLILKFSLNRGHIYKS